MQSSSLHIIRFADPLCRVSKVGEARSFEYFIVRYMARPMLVSTFALALLVYSSVAFAEIVEHHFHVKNVTINRLCHEQFITTVNGDFPGPTIEVYEGDTLVVHVFNESPYNITIHWHGVFQLRSGWADGTNYVTQCPILPGNKYIYRFTITGQEGTLWWHAHANWLRATVHGALIIRPREGRNYLFPKPFGEFPIVLGEWWNSSIMEIESQALADGHGPNISNAYTINGLLGDLYNCSSDGTYKLKVVPGETYLLRIINAALNNQIFFKIASHTMTVVAVDASYTDPMLTDTVVITPGQSVDVLLTANQPLAAYYMAAHAYDSLGAEFDETTTTGIIMYENATTSSAPLMPTLPAFNDTSLAFHFYSNLTSLVNAPHWVPVPLEVDKNMFVTVGLGLTPCEANNTCGAPFGLAFAACMNNESFELPTKLSMLEASFYNLTTGIYTTDFPSSPPVVFDYTNTSLYLDKSLIMTSRSTKVTKLKFNSTVQIVFQNTALVSKENHPVHLHGYNFYVLAQGFGNYDPLIGPTMFNLVNPQKRNTLGVPVGGWAVIRFTVNNPGVWLMHCHFDTHITWGLATAFIVEDGPTPETSLPPPPPDLPFCIVNTKKRRFFNKGDDNAKTIFANAKTLAHKWFVFVWSGSWPAFLVPCLLLLVCFSCTLRRRQYSYALKFWH